MPVCAVAVPDVFGRACARLEIMGTYRKPKAFTAARLAAATLNVFAFLIVIGIAITLIALVASPPQGDETAATVAGVAGGLLGALLTASLLAGVAAVIEILIGSYDELVSMRKNTEVIAER